MPEKIYVEFEGMKYRLGLPHGEIVEGRQLAQIGRGEYGELPKRIYEAQAANGLPHRFAWRSVINAIGDFSEVMPPTAGKPV